MKKEDGVEEDVVRASFLTGTADTYKLYSQELEPSN